MPHLRDLQSAHRAPCRVPREGASDYRLMPHLRGPSAAPSRVRRESPQFVNDYATFLQAHRALFRVPREGAGACQILPHLRDPSTAPSRVRRESPSN